MVDNIKIDSLEMKIDGKISLQRPRHFTEVTYEVRISSPESDDTIRKLSKTADEECFVLNTLKKACKVTGAIIHNGEKIEEHY